MGGCDRAGAVPWWEPSQESHTAFAAQRPEWEFDSGDVEDIEKEDDCHKDFGVNNDIADDVKVDIGKG